MIGSRGLSVNGWNMSWPGSIDVVYSGVVCWGFWLWFGSLLVYTSGDTTLSGLRVLYLAEIMDLFYCGLDTIPVHWELDVV